MELTLKDYPKYVKRKKNFKNKSLIIYMLNISMEKYYHYFFDDHKQ